MNPRPLTGDELREAVFTLIAREMGPATLVRYIAENFSQPGRDYTRERQDQPQPTLDEIAGQIEALRRQRGGSLAPVGAKVIPPG